MVKVSGTWVTGSCKDRKKISDVCNKTPDLILAEVSLVIMLSSSVALCSVILVGLSMHGKKLLE